jgi:hypothetical protein
VTEIRNPFAGVGVAADWAWHRAHRFGGGTDYAVRSGQSIAAPASGRMRYLHDGLNGFAIDLPDGRAVAIRESSSIALPDGATVAIGQPVAVTGRRVGTIVKYPHIEGWVGGRRIVFESMLSPAVAAAGLGPVVPISAGWAWNAPGADIQLRVQIALAKRGRYGGPQNGVWGPRSIIGIQTTVANVGYTGPRNGEPGEHTCHFVQVYAARFGGYGGPVNAVLGPNSWLGFCRGLEAGLA